MTRIYLFDSIWDSAVVYQVGGLKESKWWRLEFKSTFSFNVGGKVTEAPCVWFENVNEHGMGYRDYRDKKYPMIVTFHDKLVFPPRWAGAGYHNFPTSHELYVAFDWVMQGATPDPFFDLLRDHLPESHPVLDQIFG